MDSTLLSYSLMLVLLMILMILSIGYSNTSAIFDSLLYYTNSFEDSASEMEWLCCCSTASSSGSELSESAHLQ